MKRNLQMQSLTKSSARLSSGGKSHAAGAIRSHSLYLRMIIGTSLLLAVCLVFAGCSGTRSGNGGSFSYYLTENITSLDPQTAEGTDAAAVINALFEGLCRIENGEAVPGTALSWESNSDYTSFTFYLNEKAVWSDGTPVTADDFVYGIQRALDPNTGAVDVDDLFVIMGAKEVYDGIASPSSIGVTAVGSYTLTFQLEESCRDFPKLTAGTRYMPCNREFFSSTLGRYGLKISYLITNGPFTFINSYSWSSGEYIKLENSDSYAGEYVKPGSLTFYLTDDEIADDPLTAVTDGTTDAAQLNSVDEYYLASEEGCTVYRFNNTVTGLLFNSSDSELKYTKIREIFIKSINRDKLMDVLPTELNPAEDIIPSGLQYDGSDYRSIAESSLYVRYNEAVLDYENYHSESDNEYADLLGAQTEGFTDEDSDSYTLEGSDDSVNYMPSVTIICRNDSVSTAIASAIMASWNCFDGSYFNILPLSDEDFFDAISSGDYQAAIYTVESSSDTALSMMAQFDSDSYPQLLDSAAYDTLLHGKNTSAADITALEKFINNQYIFYPIYYGSSYYAVAPGVDGLEVGIGRIDFVHASK